MPLGAQEADDRPAHQTGRIQAGIEWRHDETPIAEMKGCRIAGHGGDDLDHRAVMSVPSVVISGP